MSEYQGPIFQNKKERPVSQRRFNRLDSKQSAQNIFDNNHDHQTHWANNSKDYQLPEKSDRLLVNEHLTKPVNKEKLKRNIDRITQVQQQHSIKEDYQIPFLKQTKKESPSEYYEEMKSNQEKISNNLKRSKSINEYRPAYQGTKDSSEQPIRKANEAQQVVDDRLIRELAMRLIKEKVDFLLFEKS